MSYILRQADWLLRRERKGVGCCGVGGCGREGHGEGGFVVPGGPLIEEPRAGRAAGLAEDDVECGVIEVGEVGGKTLRGTEVAPDLFDSVGVAALRPYTGSDGKMDEPAQDGGAQY